MILPMSKLIDVVSYLKQAFPELRNNHVLCEGKKPCEKDFGRS
jgi:hypothetical protein